MTTLLINAKNTRLSKRKLILKEKKMRENCHFSFSNNAKNIINGCSEDWFFLSY